MHQGKNTLTTSQKVNNPIANVSGIIAINANKTVKNFIIISIP
jgi:hypothetical protein